MIFVTIFCGRRVLAVFDNANRPHDRPWIYLYRQDDPDMRRRGQALLDAARRRWRVEPLPSGASPLELYSR